MANHLVVDIHASKLTTHEPDDYDVDYISYLIGEMQKAMQDHGFHNARVDWKITNGTDSG